MTEFRGVQKLWLVSSPMLLHTHLGANLCLRPDFSRPLPISHQVVFPGSNADGTSPFGGIKESGYGKEGGHQGTEEYMVTKMIALGTATKNAVAPPTFD